MPNFVRSLVLKQKSIQSSSNADLKPQYMHLIQDVSRSHRIVGRAVKGGDSLRRGSDPTGHHARH